MAKYLTPTRLRVNLYRILDHVIESGEAVEVRRNGKRVRIIAEPGSKLDLLRPHPDYANGSCEDFVHMDWSGEWRP